MTKNKNVINLHKILQQGYRYAYSLTHNVTHAEDLVQDAWLSILKKQAPQTIPYFFTVIRNCFLNQLKRDKIVPLMTIEGTDTKESLLSNEKDFCEIMANKDQINKALAQLRDIERECIFLYYIEEYTMEEIAQHTSLSKGMICSLVYRARLKLQKIITTQKAGVA